MTSYARFETPLGLLIAVCNDGGLTGLYFHDEKHAVAIQPDWREEASARPLADCRRQLDEYFAGRRRTFDVVLAAEGTEFQKRVWNQIARIPYGETITYSELARRAGSPGSSRAAGAATGRNPISILVPCHRVVGSDGSLTGYAGGLPRKTRLLEIEGALQGSLV